MRYVLSIIIAAAIVAVSAHDAAAQNEVTEHVSKTSRLDMNGAFDLTNISGTITITASEGREVTIDALKRVQRPNANAARNLLQLIDIQIVEQPNRIEVRTAYPRPRNFPGLVDYTIAVPADASVTVRTVAGDIHATNVRGEVLRSVSGDIEVNNGSVEDLVTVSTVSGSINVRGLKARAIQLGTVTGNVHVADVQADRLAVRAVNGNIDYTGDLARNGRYEFVSHSGDVRLLLSGGTGFAVQANSFSGTVRSDFPINRRGGGGEGRAGGGILPRAIRGAFGDASAMLVVRAFSGNIVVGRR